MSAAATKTRSTAGVAARKETINAFTQERNKKLKERFNTLYNVKRTRYEDVLNTLKSEFFISEKRIVKILRDQV